MDELEKEILRLIGIKVTWPRFRGEFKTENHVDRALDAKLGELDSKKSEEGSAELAIRIFVDHCGPDADKAIENMIAVMDELKSYTDLVDFKHRLSQL